MIYLCIVKNYRLWYNECRYNGGESICDKKLELKIKMT